MSSDASRNEKNVALNSSKYRPIKASTTNIFDPFFKILLSQYDSFVIKNQTKRMTCVFIYEINAACMY